MDFNHKWGTVLLNATLGSGYVTLILLMIQWVSTDKTGIIGFLVSIGLLVIITLAWTLLDRKKYDHHKRHQIIKQIDG